MISITLFLFAAFVGNEDIIFTKNFPLEFSEEEEDDELVDPHFFDFSPRGDLYLLERLNPRILHWDADGNFKGSFGSKGQGPGEFRSPQLIHATKDEVWVWDRASGFSIFDLDGKYKTRIPAFNARIRRFAVVNQDTILIAYQKRGSQPVNHFALTDRKGKIIKDLVHWNNEAFLAPVEGDDKAHVVAYLPEVEIYSDKNGLIHFGFSQNKTIYTINNQGQITFTVKPSFITGPSNDVEKEAWKRFRFTGDNGKVYTHKTMPSVKWDYTKNKAYYTHFIVKGQKLATVLTPISGTDQQKAYNEGFYYLYPFSDGGKPSKRGYYRFADDSQIMYNNGRMLAVFINDEDEYEVKEFTFKGF